MDWLGRIKQIPQKLWQWFAGLVDSDFAKNLARDFKSLRSLWNWIYMALYVWICVMTVLHHPQAIPTAITVTGSVISVIFTGYVLSKTYEKIRMRNYIAPASNAESGPTEGESGD
jgi:hypothetical protein